MKLRLHIVTTVILTLAAAGAVAAAPSLRDWRQLADRMVDEEIVAAGVTNQRVIEVMRETPRHEFVPMDKRELAYLDIALPIGGQQTISPPFIVAYMTQEIDPQPTDRVLEIGTGSGYQAAVLSPLVKDVYTIEIVESLGRRAARTLKRLSYKNVFTKVGDGYKGWPEAAPFDKIIVTCSPEKVPQPLVDQLAEGGLMIVPVGERYQQTLHLLRKREGKLESESLRATLFVPMTGQAESERAVQPDPKNPQLTNGSFEQVVKSEDKDPQPAGWHYLRQITLKTGRDAPDGEHYAVFRNEQPGRSSRALQGLAIDGRAVSSLRLSFSVRGRDIERGPTPEDWPHVVITFYDQDRAAAGEQSIGPFYGTFDWRREDHVVRVPLRAREAIVRVDLLGAVGEIGFDDLRVEAADR